MTIQFCTENDMLDEDIKLFVNTLSKDDELLGERFKVLSSLLKQMGY